MFEPHGAYITYQIQPLLRKALWVELRSKGIAARKQMYAEFMTSTNPFDYQPSETDRDIWVDPVTYFWKVLPTFKGPYLALGFESKPLQNRFRHLIHQGAVPKHMDSFFYVVVNRNWHSDTSMPGYLPRTPLCLQRETAQASRHANTPQWGVEIDVNVTFRVTEG